MKCLLLFASCSVPRMTNDKRAETKKLKRREICWTSVKLNSIMNEQYAKEIFTRFHSFHFVRFLSSRFSYSLVLFGECNFSVVNKDERCKVKEKNENRREFICCSICSAWTERECAQHVYDGIDEIIFVSFLYFFFTVFCFAIFVDRQKISHANGRENTVAF